VRDCKFSRDQRCIRFNRYLFDKYLMGKGGSGGGRRKPNFSNARYYDMVAADSKKLPSPKSIQHAKSADSAMAPNSHFDDYFKALQRTQSAPEPNTTSNSGRSDEGPKSDTEEGQIEENGGKKDGDGQDGKGNGEDAPKMGFKFGDEIEGLRIFRTIDEIKTSLKEHQEELERDQKEIDSRSTAHNKWIRSADDCGDRRRQNSKWNESDSRKRKRNGEGNGGRDSNRAPHNAVREYVKSRERARGRDYDSRSRSRGRDKRDRDGDGDRHRSRSGRHRERRDRSRDRSRSRGRAYERSRSRGRNGGGHHDQKIDYGFSGKKDKINKYIDDRYKKRDGRGRQAQDRSRKR